MNLSAIIIVLLYLVFVIGIYNILPLEQLVSIGVNPFVLLITLLAINIMYYYWRYVFIGVFIQSELARGFKGIFRLFVDRMKKFKPLLYGFIAVKLTVFIVIFIIYPIIDSKSLVEYTLWFQSLGFLFLEYFMAPYLLLNRIARRRQGYEITTIILAYSLPWAIIGLALSTFINMPILLMFGRLTMYPYYHGWGHYSTTLLVDTPMGSLIPTVGEVFAAIIIAYYTEAAVYGYV